MSVTRTSALSEVSTARLDLAREVPRVARCPLCHTMHSSLTAAALEAGGEWHCARCGQHWNAVRLANDAAYAAWVVEHDAPR
jgi:transcription elongation factor Elf1